MLAPVFVVLAAFAATPTGSKILFPRDADVPRPVQEFAWRVIETRCNYQPYDLAQRSFWAYDAHATRGDARVVYSIAILSELGWKKSEPPAIVKMTIADEGGMRLIALTSTYVVCARDTP